MAKENPTESQAPATAEQHTKKSLRAAIAESRWVTPIVWLSRIILGGTFVFSGFVKAIDPWGTVIKMEEYLQAMGLDTWVAVALPLAFLLFTIEFLLGVYIITGAYRKIAAWGTTLFMLVMLPLSLWIYIKNPVPDCGCFGDALVISNAATFWKNVVLTICAFWLLLFNRHARTLVMPGLQWIESIASVAFIVYIGWVGYIYQPLIDFRPYPVGSKLYSTTDVAEPEIFGIYERDGERIKLPIDSIPDDSWSFVERQEAVPQAARGAEESASQAAVFNEDGEDVTDEVLGNKEPTMVIFYSSLPDISLTTFYRTNSLQQYCESRNIDLIAIASATPQQVADFRDLSLSEFPIYLADESWIKEVVRGNPAVAYLSGGKIIWKSSLAAMTPDDFMSATAPKNPEGFKINDNKLLHSATGFYLLFIALLMTLSFIPRLARLIRRRKSRFIKDTAAVAALLIALSSCSSSHDEPDPEPPTRDVESATLIYMVASNNLSYNAANDLSEIIKAAEYIDTEVNRIFLFQRGISSIPGSYTSLWEIVNRNGAVEMVELKSYSDELSVVSPYFFTNVIADFTNIAPAKSYGLFLWSHASGWLPGKTEKAPQKSFGDDKGLSINIESLAEAIPDNLFRYIWCDCCFMGNIETQYALRNKAAYIVASPTEIMAEGAPYDIILPYVAASEPDIIGAAKKEFEYYSSPQVSSLGFTISVTNCSKLDNVASEAAQLLGGQYPFISVSPLQKYGSTQAVLPDNHYKGVTFYDFGHTFRSYAEVLGVNFAGFEQALYDAVIYKAATPKFRNIVIAPETFSGLTVNVPLDPTSYSHNETLDEFYRSLSWTKAVAPNY